MTVTAAAYDYKYDELQVQAQTIINDVPLLTLTNAANARIRGVELGLSGHLTKGLSFNVGGNWLPKADYSKYKTAQVTVPVSGTAPITGTRSEEHTSELQSLMRISYAVFCLKKKIKHIID